jgi:cyclopropane-fatty-acyl-phospholipid synthase
MAPRAQGATAVSSFLEMQVEDPLPTVNFTRWPELAQPKRAMVFAALARSVFRRAVDRAGVLVKLPDGSCFGSVSGPLLEIRRPEAFFSRLGRDGKIGFGEAYMAGDWEAPHLGDVLEALARQIDTLVPPKLQWIRRMYEPRLPKEEDNDHDGARRNIARHYDLSNDLFATFLDGSMTYSSALFAPGVDETLAQAQARKIDRLLDATGVGRGTRLLEIGTGWGGLALRAARRGARVTSVTLSQEQASFARRRIEEAELTAAVDVRVEDYRDVTGQFEAVVSIEMLEAVGERWWPEYFSALERRLVPTGRIGLQTILMAHDRLLATKASWTWIHKYIFPGGLIPSEQAIRQTVADHTKLQVLDQLHFGESYGTTLRHWRQTFDARAERVDALGFDRTFRRMWDFYLAYSEAGFRTGYLDVAQFVLAPGGLPSSIDAR